MSLDWQFWAVVTFCVYLVLWLQLEKKLRLRP